MNEIEVRLTELNLRLNTIVKKIDAILTILEANNNG